MHFLSYWLEKKTTLHRLTSRQRRLTSAKCQNDVGTAPDSVARFRPAICFRINRWFSPLPILAHIVLESAIYWRKFDVITYCPFSLAGIWFYTANSKSCSFVQIVNFSQQNKMNKCIRMGITAFKIVIWGGILSAKFTVLWRVAVKRNFRPYNADDYFECSYVFLRTETYKLYHHKEELISFKKLFAQEQ